MKDRGFGDTLDMFNPAPPAQAHSETSREAAHVMERTGASCAGRARVLKCLRDLGEVGATDEEMQCILDMNPSTQRPRRIELQRLGLVRDSGTCRGTKSGRRAVVWRADTEVS